MTSQIILPFLRNILPELNVLTHFTVGAEESIIHAPGFEDRTMSIMSVLGESPYGNALLLNYLPYDSKNRLLDVRNELSNHGVKTVEEDILLYNRYDPADFESRLHIRMVEQGVKSVILDISTMSKLAIILILNTCRAMNLKVRIVYAEAAEYGPSEEEFEHAKSNKEIHQPSLQVYTGVHGVVRVDSLASVAMQGQPTAALVFMSFNDALTQVLLNAVYPSRLFLINGKPPVMAWREVATAWIHDQVRREWEGDNLILPDEIGGVPLPKRVVSTLDYRETVSLLLELYWKLSSSHRILLAPAGSKLQAVGSFLVKALHPDIHIEYPTPAGFQQFYSSGIGNMWSLDFGHIAQLLSIIALAERKEYLEIPVV